MPVILKSILKNHLSFPIHLILLNLAFILDTLVNQPILHEISFEKFSHHFFFPSRKNPVDPSH